MSFDLTLSTSAPAAYEDTVRVCVACSRQLMAMDAELSHIASQQRGATAAGDTLNPTSQQMAAGTQQPVLDREEELLSADTVHSE